MGCGLQGGLARLLGGWAASAAVALASPFLAHRVKLVMALDAVGLVGTSDIVCGGAFTPAGDFQKMLFFIAMERLTLACVGSLFF